MRTLSRPMFNMGGPIKQGIMHGIREPYRGGGKAALVGDPVFPKDRTGRAHHAYWLIPTALRALGSQALKKGIGSAATGDMAKRGIQESIKRAAGTGSGAGITTTAPAQGFFRSAWEGDPLVRGTKWLYRTLKSPTAKGWAQKAAKTVVSPTGALTAGYFGGKKLLGGDDAVDSPTGTVYPNAPGAEAIKEKAVLSQSQKDAFAKAEREKRVNKYLDMMGYDRSKKMAIADALIDASKIVSDRGTLDPKNITQELINPVIQATSKRLDKPQQIREAVGLMMTKAGLEKEMYEAKPGTVLKNVQDMVKSGNFTEEEAWAIATKGSQGVIADLQGAISTGKVSMADWPSFVRATGAQHGEDVTVITAEEIKKDPEKYARFKDKSIMEIVEGSPDGIYVIGSETVRIKGGKKTQIR